MAAWDVCTAPNTTQLGRVRPCDVQRGVAATPQPAAMQQYLDKWENIRYTFHWYDQPIPPLLLEHSQPSSHQQDALWGSGGPSGWN